MSTHNEIFPIEQAKLLPIVRLFHKNFGLVGGTAIALQIGHRQSLDFDMFSLREFSNTKIKKLLTDSKTKISKVYKDEKGQFTFLVNNVQFTFFHYPFNISFPVKWEAGTMPSLLTLAAMKAYALGRRAKWKDYVDLYFIIKNHYSFEEVKAEAKKIFKGEFNERIFRESLSYFEDISYAEPVTFLPGQAVPEKTIKRELIKFSVK